MRATAEQADKWRDHLTEGEVARVLEGAASFGILDHLYPAPGVAARQA